MKKLLSILTIFSFSNLITMPIISCTSKNYENTKYNSVISSLLDYKLSNIYNINYIDGNKSVKEFVKNNNYLDTNLKYLLSDKNIFNENLKNEIVNYLTENSDLVLYDIVLKKVIFIFDKNETKTLNEVFKEKTILKSNKENYRLARQIKFKPFNFSPTKYYISWFNLINQNIIDNRNNIFNTIINKWLLYFTPNFIGIDIYKILLKDFMKSDFIENSINYLFKADLNDLYENKYFNDFYKTIGQSSLLRLKNHNSTIFTYNKNTDKRTLWNSFIEEIKNNIIITDKDKQKYLDKKGNIIDLFFQENNTVLQSLFFKWNNNEYDLNFNLWLFKNK